VQSAEGCAEFGPQLAKSSAREQQLDGLGAEGFGMTFPALKVFHKALLKCYSICPLLRGNLNVLQRAVDPSPTRRSNQKWRLLDFQTILCTGPRGECHMGVNKPSDRKEG